MGGGMARKPQALPDYFTPEEARALVAAAPSYQVRMAMRVMLRTGLRVGECLSLRAADLRFNQDPPIISLRPEVTGNKSKKGREVPIPHDLEVRTQNSIRRPEQKEPPRRVTERDLWLHHQVNPGLGLALLDH